jgi:hypothetical protein
MKFPSVIRFMVLGLTIMGAPALLPVMTGSAQAASQSVPTEIHINAAIPATVLVQSPADTHTELQIICLFESVPANTLRGSLNEMNEKLKGLLSIIRSPDLFRGLLGETLLINPPAGSLFAKRLMVIGLGDAQTYAPQRMELVGSIVYREANRLGIEHPFFAPTVLDGGVTKFNSGETAEHFFAGFLRAARTEKMLRDVGASAEQTIQDITFLAGPSHAVDTQHGLERAVSNPER